MPRLPLNMLSASFFVYRLRRIDWRIGWPPLSNERFFLWLPVFFATGTALYFYGDKEPSFLLIFSFFLLFMFGAGLSQPLGLKRFCMAISCITLGLIWTQMSSLDVDAPMLKRVIKETNLSGTIIRKEVRLRGDLIELDVHNITALKRVDTPHRLTLYGRKNLVPEARAGCKINLRARLMPLAKPVLPNHYDPRLNGHFNGIGGRGFVREINSIECPDSVGFHARLQQWRVGLAERISAGMSEGAAGIGVALMTGLRGGIPTDKRDVLRASGLAHMLAISGMHMALVAGTIYAVLRLVFAFFPNFVQRVNVRIICGLGGAAGGTAYLLLSGMSVATQRAYVMMSLVFLAIIFGRHALTLRNVAIAAFIVLLISPAAILQAGFQMSFAAVLALVAFYENFGRAKWWPHYQKRLSFWAYRRRRIGLYFLALIFTSLIAGAVTGYIGAYHFYYLSTYGLAANLLAVPVLGMIIMPAGLLAVLLMPFHLELWPLKIMSVGIDWVIAAAEWTTQPESAVVYLPATPPTGLFCFALGLLLICLLPDRRRLLGVVPILISMVLLGRGAPPELLVHGHVQHIALRQTDGHYHLLSRHKHNFVPTRWLAANGQTDLPANVQEICTENLCLLTRDGFELAYASDRTALLAACQRSDLVLAGFRVAARDKKRCGVQIFDRRDWRFDLVRTFEYRQGAWHINKRPKTTRLWME